MPLALQRVHTRRAVHVAQTRTWSKKPLDSHPSERSETVSRAALTASNCLRAQLDHSVSDRVYAARWLWLADSEGSHHATSERFSRALPPPSREGAPTAITCPLSQLAARCKATTCSDVFALTKLSGASTVGGEMPPRGGPNGEFLSQEICVDVLELVEAANRAFIFGRGCGRTSHLTAAPFSLSTTPSGGRGGSPSLSTGRCICRRHRRICC
jgi:hypothetical protein